MTNWYIISLRSVSISVSFKPTYGSASVIVASISRKGNCWDNVPMELFFATLMTELIYYERFITRKDAKSNIFDYIVMFYKRRRSSLEYKSPIEFKMTEKSALPVLDFMGEVQIFLGVV